MDNYIKKIEENLFTYIDKFNKPKILELGVQQGISTKRLQKGSNTLNNKFS